MAPLDAEKRARLQAILEAEQAKSALAQKVRPRRRSSISPRSGTVSSPRRFSRRHLPPDSPSFFFLLPSLFRTGFPLQKRNGIILLVYSLSPGESQPAVVPEEAAAQLSRASRSSTPVRASCFGDVFTAVTTLASEAPPASR